MSNALGGVQLFLVAGAAFLLFGSFIAALAVWALRRTLPALEPLVRHRVLQWLLYLPPLTMATLLVCVSLPAFASLWEPASDHCLQHHHDSAHLCFTHVPNVGIPIAVSLGLVFLVSYALIQLGLLARGVLRAEWLLSALAETGEQRPDLGVTLVESARPLCFAGGLLWPRIFLSRNLLAALSADQQAAVIAHERAHVRRRDALFTNLACAAGLFHIPFVSRWLRVELQVAAEQICDEESAAVVGDRLVVASAILAMERALQSSESAGLSAASVGFGGVAIERRVQALLAAPLTPKSLKWAMASCAAVMMAAFLSAHELHHLAEDLLSLIAY